MTTNIVVFKPPETPEVKSNKTELEIIYDEFVKTASIQPHHFKIFMEMEQLEDLNVDIKSNLPSILIKKILPYCIPIVKTIPDYTVKTKKVDNFKKAKVPEKFVEQYYGISIQLEYPTECVFKYDQIVDEKTKLKTIVIPKHETFRIIGIKIPDKIVKNVDKSFLNRMAELSNIDILQSGIFGTSEFQSGNYTQSRLSDITPQSVSKTHATIYFDSDDDARIKIQIVDKYIKYINNFYQTNMVMVYRYLYNRPFSTHIKIQEQLFNIFNPEYYNKESKIQHEPAATLIAKLINTQLGDSTHNNDFMFNNHQVFDKLHHILLLGLSNESSKKKLQELNIQKLHIDTLNEFNKLKFQKKLEYAKKKAISFNKFKISNLMSLTDNQTKIVNLEFEKMEKVYSDVKNNSNDFKVVNTLYWAMETGKTQIITEKLSEIDKLVKIPKDLTDPKINILQKYKKISLICPHVIVKARHMIKKNKNELTKSGLIREYLINHFSLPVMTDGYFCRICGELLADADAEEILKYISGTRVTFDMGYDRLKSQMWKEVAHIITSYVKFKDAVNHKNIITSITNTLRPEMGTIESTLSKIKSNSKDNIKDLMRIYTVIYTFAIIVNMIVKNYGKITFTMRPISNRRPGKQGGVKKRKKRIVSRFIDTSRDSSDDESSIIENTKTIGGINNPRDTQKTLQNIINNALFLILRILNVVINDVTSISTDSIKPILIKAYRWVATLHVENTQGVIKKEVHSDEVSNIKDDKIYKYITYVMDLVEFCKKKNKTIIQKHDIKDVLGRSWQSIESGFAENISMYATAIIPDQWSETKISKYKYDSFKSLIEYVKNKLYDEFAVPYTQPLIEYDKKYKYLKSIEEEIYQSQKRMDLRPFNNIFLQDNYMMTFNDFSPNLVKIDKYYDNDGRRHKFDIFVYQNANSKGVLSGPKREYAKADINNWLQTQDMKKTMDFKQLFIVDEKCSVCNVLLSQTKNKTVETAITELDNSSIFYRYFENRCPIGELHDFIISVQKNKESSCSKCGMTESIVLNRDKKYYDKYIKTYNKIISDKISLEREEISRLCNTTKDKIVNKKFPEWKFNNAPILELSRTFKIKYNIWINLGLTINRKFSLIESEKINPSESVTPNMTILRNKQLYSYYLHVVTLFYSIKNYDIIQKIPYDLKQLMSKNKVRDLHEKLINIDQEILEKYNYYKDNMPQSIVSNFLLYSISITIINIYKSMKNANMAIANDAINYIINNIIQSEKMLSEPDLTKFATSVVASNNNDLNVDINIMSDIEGDDVQDGYFSAVDSEKSLGELSDANPDDEFSINDLDIEVDADENLINNAMGF